MNIPNTEETFLMINKIMSRFVDFYFAYTIYIVICLFGSVSTIFELSNQTSSKVLNLWSIWIYGMVPSKFYVVFTSLLIFQPYWYTKCTKINKKEALTCHSALHQSGPEREDITSVMGMGRSMGMFTRNKHSSHSSESQSNRSRKNSNTNSLSSSNNFYNNFKNNNTPCALCGNNIIGSHRSNRSDRLDSICSDYSVGDPAVIIGKYVETHIPYKNTTEIVQDNFKSELSVTNNSTALTSNSSCSGSASKSTSSTFETRKVFCIQEENYNNSVKDNNNNNYDDNYDDNGNVNVDVNDNNGIDHGTDTDNNDNNKSNSSTYCNYVKKNNVDEESKNLSGNSKTNNSCCVSSNISINISKVNVDDLDSNSNSN
eukprot:Pgem_evm1s14047